MPNDSRRYGRYLDEFEVGAVYHHEPSKTICESDNNLFCLLTCNLHPLHINAPFAACSQHGRILVVGTYVISLVVGLSVADTSGKAIANLEYDNIRHEKPVFIGDTIRAESEVLAVRSSVTKPDRGIVHIETRAFNQRGERVLTLRRKMLVSLMESK